MTTEPILLPKQARQILAELELIQHGSITAYNSSGGRSSDRDPCPSGESWPPHLKYEALFLEAVEADPERLPALIRMAKTELDEIVRGNREDCKRVKKTDDDLKRDVLRMAGWTPREVANRLAGIVTQGQVIAWRREKHKDVSTGYDPRPEEDKRDRVLRLHRSGVSTRQIATSLDVHQR